MKPFILWLLVGSLLYGLNQSPPLVRARTYSEQAITATSFFGLALRSMVNAPLLTLNSFGKGQERIADLEQRLAMASVEAGDNDVSTRKIHEQAMFDNIRLPQAFKAVATSKIFSNSDGKSIAVGSQHGIEAGMVVIDQQGMALGIVGQVGHYVSRITTLTRIKDPIAVRIAGKEIEGTLVGDGTVVRMVNVMQGLELMPGEVVITDGSDNVFPAGLVVGYVIEIESKPSEVMQTALVDLAGVPQGTVLVGR